MYVALRLWKNLALDLRNLSSTTSFTDVRIYSLLPILTGRYGLNISLPHSLPPSPPAVAADQCADMP